MAKGGSYNAGAFTASTPMPLEWQQWQMYRDTQNPFASGGRIESAGGGGSNYLGGSSPRAINFGGRDYGSQELDRDELRRIGSTAVPLFSGIIDNIKEWRERQQANQTYPTAGSTAGPSTPAGRSRRGSPTGSATSSTGRSGGRQSAPPAPVTLPPGVPSPPGGPLSAPPPPQPRPLAPPTMSTPPTPPIRTPHPLATSNWREEQAQRLAEYEMGEPGQPTPDPSVGSRAYQEEVARRRAERAPQPEPTPATGSQRLSQAWKLQAEREAAVEARGGRGPMPGSAVANNRSPDLLPPEMRPGAVGTAKIPSPMSAVGGQEERLAAEGTTPRTRKKP